MPILNPEQWQEISPHLDHALSLPLEERAAWLDILRTERSDLAELVQKLLEDHHALSEEHFLECQPELPGSEPGLAGEILGPYRLLSPIGEG